MTDWVVKKNTQEDLIDVASGLNFCEMKARKISSESNCVFHVVGNKKHWIIIIHWRNMLWQKYNQQPGVTHSALNNTYRGRFYFPLVKKTRVMSILQQKQGKNLKEYLSKRVLRNLEPSTQLLLISCGSFQAPGQALGSLSARVLCRTLLGGYTLRFLSGSRSSPRFPISNPHPRPLTQTKTRSFFIHL